MTTMLENAARELCIVQEDLAGLEPAEPTADDIAHAMPQVLAVLRMIREPDEAMMNAAAETPGMKAAGSAMQLHQARGYGFDPTAFNDGSPLEQAWRAAIDTITTEGTGE